MIRFRSVTGPSRADANGSTEGTERSLPRLQTLQEDAQEGVPPAGIEPAHTV